MTNEIQPLRHPKKQLIIDNALVLLRDNGDHGLTMRKLASKAGISLSNVQYYFKNKNELLKAMVGYFFEECEAEFSAHLARSNPTNTREWVESILEYGLVDIAATPEICMVLREFWAISSRNEEIANCLDSHYRKMIETLVLLVPVKAPDKEMATKVVALLVPYLEGYTLTAPSLPLEREEVVALFADVLVSIIGE